MGRWMALRMMYILPAAQWPRTSRMQTHKQQEALERALVVQEEAGSDDRVREASMLFVVLWAVLA